MLKIRALGGSGEDSRNCFLITSNTKTILLDCGVRREIADISVVYPLLTEEIARSIDFVLLSHCHEDHTAALAYLYELGFRGPVYGSKETIENTPSFIKKWVDFVNRNNGSLPFDPTNINELDFRDIQTIDDFTVSTGKNGHILGGNWFHFTLDNKSILYTGDITADSYTLKTDSLPEADVLIIDCAYAGKTIDQQKQFNILCSEAEKTLKKNGTLLLPVPANGRGIDMCEILKANGFNIWADEKIVKNALNLFSQKSWIKNIDFIDNHYGIITKENSAEVLSQPSIILVPDGMMTTETTEFYFNQIKNSARSEVILTGHQAIGTLGNSILNTDFRKENHIKCQVESLTIKVHLDDKDVLEQIQNVKPDCVVLFHADKDSCCSLIKSIEDQNITVLCDTKRCLTVV